MGLFDVVAASQQGLAFDNLARRFRATPQQTSIVVEALVAALMLSIDEHLKDPLRAAALLERLDDASLAGTFEATTLPADAIVREQGLSLLADISQSRDIPARAIVDAAMRSGLSTSDVERLLPIVAVMTMSAIRHRATEQIRGLLGTIWKSPSRAAKASHPFSELAKIVREPSAARQSGSSLIANLFARHQANDDPATMAWTN